MKNPITYFTDPLNIEDNAYVALKKFESKDNIHEISVFPDIHFCSEKSIPVGVAFQTTDVFYPLITGQDMGCGVAYLQIPIGNYLKPFDNKKHYRAFERESRTMTDEGLGGGNHFLSLEKSDKYLYIIVHTGSRNLGIHQYQQNLLLLNQHNPGQEWLPISVATPEYRAQYEQLLMYASSRRNEFLLGTLQFLIKNGYVSENTPYFSEDSNHNSLDFITEGEKVTRVIHRKGSTNLYSYLTPLSLSDLKNPRYGNVVIPLSMTRGSLIVKANQYDEDALKTALNSCSHGAGRKLSRVDTLKHWHSLKKSERDLYMKNFPELLNRSGEFDSSLIQEFDFAYKDSKEILSSQPYLIKVDETRPIATVKFTAV